MNENIIVDKSFQFAIRMVRLYQFLTKKKKEFILSKQLLRSGTSIGANISEAQRGQSIADFHAKMAIALKEANETHYWLELLYHTDYLSEPQYTSLINDTDELIKILIAICKASESKK